MHPYFGSLWFSDCAFRDALSRPPQDRGKPYFQIGVGDLLGGQQPTQRGDNSIQLITYRRLIQKWDA